MTPAGAATGFAEVSHARLGAAQSQEMLDYVWTPYAAYEPENVRAIAQANIAHAIALAEAGLIDAEVAEAIREALGHLITDPDALEYDAVRGDLFFNVEAYLMDQIGRDDGGRLHMGRSRIDLISALMHMRTRDGLLRVLGELVSLQTTLVELAGRHAETLMQAYTHLQPAQVTTLGHYLIGFVDAFGRDAERLTGALRHANQSPLGSAATSGSGWLFSRERVAELLGFETIVENTKDGGHNFDWLAEAVSAAAITMNNVGRIAWDLYIWASDEFGMVTIDGSYAASSSIMPQKRNPYSLEMIRARSSEIAASPASVLNILMGDSGGTAFDVKLVGQRLSTHVLDRTADMLALLAGVLRTLHVNEDHMRARCGHGFSTAVGLVEHLVREHGLPFRQAHLVLGAIVRLAEERGLQAEDVDSDLVREAAAEVLGIELALTNEEIRAALDPEAFVASRVTKGGPAPVQVRRMVQSRAHDVDELRAAVSRRREAIEGGLAQL